MSNATFDSRQAAFEAVYRATAYLAVWPQDASTGATVHYISLRIGEPNADLDAWLNSLGELSWAYLTAANPGSHCLSEAENAARHDTLVAQLRAQGRRFLYGSSLADDGQWPAEPSLLVAGLDESAARKLAAQLSQNAFLAGVLGQAVKLCWTPQTP